MLLLCAGMALQPLAFADEGGKRLFQVRCGACHAKYEFGAGALRTLRGPENELLEARKDLQAEYVRQVARTGFRNMPRLTRLDVGDAELETIAAYLAKSQPE